MSQVSDGVTVYLICIYFICNMFFVTHVMNKRNRVAFDTAPQSWFVWDSRMKNNLSSWFSNSKVLEAFTKKLFKIVSGIKLFNKQIIWHPTPNIRKPAKVADSVVYNSMINACSRPRWNDWRIGCCTYFWWKSLVLIELEFIGRLVQAWGKLFCRLGFWKARTTSPALKLPSPSTSQVLKLVT